MTVTRQQEFPVVDGFKVCKRCVENLPVEAFAIHRHSGSPLAICKACRRAYAASWERAKRQAQQQEPVPMTALDLFNDMLNQ